MAENNRDFYGERGGSRAGGGDVLLLGDTDKILRFALSRHVAGATHRWTSVAGVVA
jgi:hypothetical protein